MPHNNKKKLEKDSNQSANKEIAYNARGQWFGMGANKSEMSDEMKQKYRNRHERKHGVDKKPIDIKDLNERAPITRKRYNKTVIKPSLTKEETKKSTDWSDFSSVSDATIDHKNNDQWFVEKSNKESE